MRTSGTVDAETGASYRLTGVLIGTLLLTIAFAGCMGDEPAPGDGGGADGMTANQGLETAQQEATTWSSDATLYSVTSLETQGDAPEDWPSDAFDFEQDETLGDGYAPVWAYTFQDEEGNEVSIFVNTDQDTYRGSGDSGLSQSPLEPWEIDSPEAIDIAKEDDEFASILEAEDAEVGYFLGSGEDGASWLLNVRSESMDEESTLVVDAQTGDMERFPAS